MNRSIGVVVLAGVLSPLLACKAADHQPIVDGANGVEDATGDIEDAATDATTRRRTPKARWKRKSWAFGRELRTGGTAACFRYGVRLKWLPVIIPPPPCHRMRSVSPLVSPSTPSAGV